MTKQRLQTAVGIQYRNEKIKNPKNAFRVNC